MNCENKNITGKRVKSKGVYTCIHLLSFVIVSLPEKGLRTDTLENNPFGLCCIRQRCISGKVPVYIESIVPGYHIGIVIFHVIHQQPDFFPAFFMYSQEIEEFGTLDSL